jgi:hypothetical protein
MKEGGSEERLTANDTVKAGWNAHSCEDTEAVYIRGNPESSYYVHHGR